MSIADRVVLLATITSIGIWVLDYLSICINRNLVFVFIKLLLLIVSADSPALEMIVPVNLKHKPSPRSNHTIFPA